MQVTQTNWITVYYTEYCDGMFPSPVVVVRFSLLHLRVLCRLSRTK